MACIAVTGASGFVGRHVVRELLSRGHAVRGLVRDRETARRVLPADSDRLALAAGDVTSSDTLAELLDGCRACVHTVGIIRERPGGQTFRRLHADAVRALVAACRERGTRRLVHVSAIGVGDEGRTEYQRTKFEGETIVRRSGLDWTILRCSLIHGPGGEFTRLAAGWARGTHAPWIFMPYFTRGELSTRDVPLAPILRVAPRVQPVWVGDVARAAAECLDRPAAVGEVYHLAGPEVFTWPQFLRALRDGTPGGNEDVEPRGIPAEPAAAVARVAARLGLGSLLPFDAGMALMGSQDSTAETAKAREHLGFAPRRFADALAEYAGALR